MALTQNQRNGCYPTMKMPGERVAQDQVGVVARDLATVAERFEVGSSGRQLAHSWVSLCAEPRPT